LAVAVGGVLEQRQFGRVAEDLMERELGVAFGGDDDLRAAENDARPAERSVIARSPMSRRRSP
jgi:hypothetical protein